MFNFSDESMDVDPNYDPSDFLMHGLPQRNGKQDPKSSGKIHDDLEVSESDEEQGTTVKLEDNDPGDEGLWF